MGSEVRAASPHANSPTYGMTLYLRVYCAGGTFLREKVSNGAQKTCAETGRARGWK